MILSLIGEQNDIFLLNVIIPFNTLDCGECVKIKEHELN